MNCVIMSMVMLSVVEADPPAATIDYSVKNLLKQGCGLSNTDKVIAKVQH